MRKRTKIIATLGPASSSAKTINDLIKEGTDVFRINLSHTNIEQTKRILALLKKSSSNLKRPVATLIDLQGQKIRIKGFLKEKHLNLKVNSQFVLDASLAEDKGTIKHVGITYKELYKNVEIGDELLLSDALIKLEVTKILKGKIYTNVIRGGKLKPFQGLNKKGGGLSLQGITSKDIKDLKNVLPLEIDYVAVSFVKDANDIKEVKKIIGKTPIRIIAKIERSEALDNIDAIAKISDGLLVARGDLGVEIGIEQLPAVQDILIRKAISYDKLVIVATQMMESMINSRVPTRAEVFDVANAVTSGVDAIMLSAETAIGHYPVDVVQEAVRICEIAEKTRKKIQKIDRKEQSFVSVDQMIAMSAVYGAQKSNIKAIAALMREVRRQMIRYEEDRQEKYGDNGFLNMGNKDAADSRPGAPRATETTNSKYADEFTPESEANRIHRLPGGEAKNVLFEKETIERDRALLKGVVTGYTIPEIDPQLLVYAKYACHEYTVCSRATEELLEEVQDTRSGRQRSGSLIPVIHHVAVVKDKGEIKPALQVEKLDRKTL